MMMLVYKRSDQGIFFISKAFNKSSFAPLLAKFITNISVVVVIKHVVKASLNRNVNCI